MDADAALSHEDVELAVVANSTGIGVKNTYFRTLKTFTVSEIAPNSRRLPKSPKPASNSANLRMPPVARAPQSASSRRQPAADSYLSGSFTVHLKGRAAPTVWRWPAVWALVTGFSLQLVFGIFSSLISLAALVAADPKRCPVAPADSSLRPFCMWLVGVVGACIVGEFCTTAPWSSHSSWVMWGGICELWRLNRLLNYLRDTEP